MRKFDYIVVGAGSAGCVVASRLTEDPNVSVLLLEAGGADRHILFRLAIGFYRGYPRHVNWGYRTEPEPHLDGRQLDLPQGKVLGGSSTINGKLYSRGHPLDYDQWRQMGCEGWSYADILPYFKRSQHSWRGQTAYHGESGPLDVTPINTKPLLHEPMMAAVRKLGHPVSSDLNGKQWEGFAVTDTTVDRRGRRASSARAFIHPNLSRSNLTVELNAVSARIIVENGRAVGVEYIQGGERKVARADREVILSGGAYNTPRLLLLSGIGAADEVREHGITPVVDLPGVGKNISEHASVAMNFATHDPITILKYLRIDRAGFEFVRWATTGTGLFASQASSMQGLLRTQPSLDRPDAQIYFNPLRLDMKVWAPLFTARQEHRMNSVLILLHPQSRGWMKLRSADPLDQPRIQLNLLSEKADIDTFIRMFRLTREIYHTKPLADLIKVEADPGPNATTDAQLLDYLKRMIGTARHPVGSCRMGHGADAVVDPQLKVYGIEGLRIADASIMPTIPGGNTNAPSIMIGEKAADLIRGQTLPPAQDISQQLYDSGQTGLGAN